MVAGGSFVHTSTPCPDSAKKSHCEEVKKSSWISEPDREEKEMKRLQEDAPCPTKSWTPSWRGVIITVLLGANIVFIRIILALGYNRELSNAERSTMLKALGMNCTDMSGVFNHERSNAEHSTIKKEICVNSNDTFGGCRLCPYDWLLYGDHCFYYSDMTSKTWYQSRDYCKEMRADLLVIKDQEQQEFIESSLRERAGDLYWIGLHLNEEHWIWVDGEQYDSNVFQIRKQSPGLCILMARSGYYQSNCMSARRSICVKKAVRI
ncbi:killer cell lectin-like receptor subfamily B member 1B allele B [Hyla sarda]|uniref:killer cell lectin-like receptor subfamily B member 1B allele B n=1 Tax=Hyla sarda TaxID=327740 RepID=UPI0024C3A99C|nr:killer cell lectin-like receptor subfamily B member 1B allele B [Hyla sarda]